jgi:hypothetical protein
MRKLLLALAAMPLLAADAGAFFGEPPAYILWVPEEGFSDWQLLKSRLEGCPAAKITVAVSPDDLSAGAHDALGRLARQGKVDFALRLPGNPLLPLISSDPAAPRPGDAGTLLAEARDGYRRSLGAWPSGFVPAAGGIDASVVAAARALGFGWIATGSPASQPSSWIADNGVELVPFGAYPGLASPATGYAAPFPPDAGTFVIDENDGVSYAGALLGLLAACAARPPAFPFQTVDAGLKSHPSMPMPAKTLPPPWTGDYQAWQSSAPLQGAWRLYEEAAQAVRRYQNSGSAVPETIDAAESELHRAQANAYYRLWQFPEPTAARLRGQFLSAVSAVYRKLGMTAPELLKNAESALARSEPAAAATAPATESSWRVESGDGWIEFHNAESFLAPASSSSAVLQASGAVAASSAAWTIDSLRLEWDDRFVRVIATMGDLAPSPSTPYGLGPLLLDVYMDLNHIPGAGRTSLLPGRRAYVRPENGWEDALVVSGFGAQLYRGGARSRPILVLKAPVQKDAGRRRVIATLPREKLRGDPRRWRYVAIAMALDPATSSRNPPRPLNAASPAAILGVLGPPEIQSLLLRRPSSGFVKLPAVGAED